MKKSEQLIFCFLAGCAMGLIVGIAIHDWSMAAHAGETISCRDRPDTKAYMARLPGESHSVESCVQALRFGSPSWVPEMGHPLQPRRAE